MSRIDTHAFGLWWKLAKGWFSTKFSSISVDLTPVEDKLDEVKEAVENIDIDTSDLAKQGTNPDVSLTTIDAKLGDYVLIQDDEYAPALADLATNFN